MDDLPPPPPTNPDLSSSYPSSFSLPPILPPKRKHSLTPLLVLGLITILALVVVLLAVKPPQPQRIAVYPPPSPVPTSPSESPVSSLAGPSPAAPRLPLTDLAGHQLITAFQNKLWLIAFTPQGPSKTLLLDVGNPVVDMSLSPNAKLLAFTYADAASYIPGSAVFPKTGLKVLDLTSIQPTELITLGNQSIRRPTWSSDSVYLSVWNNGDSDTLFDMTDKRRILDLTPTGSRIGPIVFVPGQAKFSFIDNGSLYEVQYTVDTRNKILDKANAILNFPNLPPVPDTQIYPSAGLSNYIIYHNNLGQLVLFNKQSSASQTLAESSPGPYPYGNLVAFDDLRLVYYNLGQDRYTPGIDDNPLYIYTLSSGSGRPFFTNRKTPISLTGLWPDPNHLHLLLQNSGFQVYSLNGDLQADCPYTNLSNGDIYSPQTLWSPDSKFILSAKTVQIADPFSCAVTTQFDSDTPDLVLWVK